MRVEGNSCCCCCCCCCFAQYYPGRAGHGHDGHGRVRLCHCQKKQGNGGDSGRVDLILKKSGRGAGSWWLVHSLRLPLGQLEAGRGDPFEESCISFSFSFRGAQEMVKIWLEIYEGLLGGVYKVRLA